MASIRLQCRLSERSAVMRGKSESSVRLTIPASYSESSEIWSCGPEAADAMVARPVACNSLSFRAKGPCELTVHKVASFSFSPYVAPGFIYHVNMRGTALLPPAAATLAKPSQYIVSDTSLEIFREIRQTTKKKNRGAGAAAPSKFGIAQRSSGSARDL